MPLGVSFTVTTVVVGGALLDVGWWLLWDLCWANGDGAVGNACINLGGLPRFARLHHLPRRSLPSTVRAGPLFMFVGHGRFRGVCCDEQAV
jgi:hypothetical protein